MLERSMLEKEGEGARGGCGALSLVKEKYIVGALSHTLGGARKRIAVHRNGVMSSYILRRPAFWGCAKTLRPTQRWSKGGW